MQPLRALPILIELEFHLASESSDSEHIIIVLQFSLWCFEDGVIDIALVTLQILVYFMVELKVVVQLIDQLAPHRVHRLYLSLQNDVHRKVLDLLS